jgi:hypothetical protein
MIGQAVFLVASDMSREVNSMWKVLVAWIVGGVIVLFGALCQANSTHISYAQRRCSVSGLCDSFVGADWDVRRGVFLRNIRNLDFPRAERGRPYPAALHCTPVATSVSRLGISVDANGLCSCGFRDFYQPMAGQACAFLCRIGDYLAGNPVLLLLVETKPALLAPWRDRNISGAAALTHDRQRLVGYSEVGLTAENSASQSTV